ncbi:uncharacterized protein LOC115985202 [Quercus lobata]|uniref:uncharacterized protein LOC115985202 n=1 Tax=Quercus lobata TaxID=97700 RepID=UPI0012460034|nr:uncharacterized protein LOC115985202 [Quercus lobata]
MPNGCRSFFELLEVLFCEGSGFRCALFAKVAWCLWQRRNKLRVQQQTWQLHEIGDRAKALVQEFWDANHREQQLPTRRPPVRWSPPPETSYKANFDAAIFDGTSSVGIGVVFKDHSGSIIAALSQRIESFHSVEVAEALAARRAVMLAKGA